MPATDLTHLLASVDDGGGAESTRSAAADLLPVVYDDLRRIAARHLRGEAPGHLLQPTAIVHEVYMKLVDHTRVDWRGRTHFVAVAAHAMRRVLIDHARHEKRKKRGGGRRRIPIVDAHLLSSGADLDAMDISEALIAMEEIDPGMAAVAELRLFGGLSPDEVATWLGISRRTVFREWKVGKAWLRHHLSDREGQP